MYVVTYYDRKQRIATLASITTPLLASACTVADALRLAGFAVRVWRNGHLI